MKIFILSFLFLLVSPLVGNIMDPKTLNPFPLSISEKVQNIYYAYVSWYGKPFHGRLTANGEKYNMYNDSIAAHKTLPFGTRVRITNPRNNKSIVVRINDRGPYIHGREFDLSYGAARKIGLTKKGVDKLKIEIIEDKDFYSYKIKNNDTLWKLFGQNWSKIARINKVDPQRIKKGTVIYVPYKI